MSLDELFWLILRVSALTFGGGGTAIPLLQYELVELRQALTSQQLLTAVAIGRFCPGPNSLYIASIGYMIGGWPGALVALSAMVLPCFVVIPVEYLYDRMSAIRSVQGFATGVSIGATGLIVASVWTLSQGAIVDAPTLGIAIVAALVVAIAKVDSLWVILAAIALGFGSTLI